MRARAVAVALGLLLDAAIGEPPARLHPVARFGSAMTALEGDLWRPTRTAGAAYTAVGVVVALVAGGLLEAAVGPATALTVAVALASAGRCLFEEAASVGALLEAGRVDEAREAVVALVGRDPSGLGPDELARAVVESVAENLSDAMVATAWWGLLVGARGALVHRAANTMDAMVGRRGERYGAFGWASARLDDVLAWPAARLTALLVALVAPRAARRVLAVVARQAPAHPSPNAGVAEGAFAAALGRRLGGENRYGATVEVRPALGEGPAPKVADIASALALARRVRALLVALLLGAALLKRSR